MDDVNSEVQSKSKSLNHVSWIPVTPAKPNLVGEKPIHGHGSIIPDCITEKSNFNNLESDDNILGRLPKAHFDEEAANHRQIPFLELMRKAESGKMEFRAPAQPKKSDGAAGSNSVLNFEKKQLLRYNLGGSGDSSSATWQPGDYEISFGGWRCPQDNSLVQQLRRTYYDLNLTPGFDTSPGKGVHNFVPATPDKPFKVYSKRDSRMQKLYVGDVQDEDRVKLMNKNTTEMVDVNELSSLQESTRPASDFSAAADSTALQANQNTNKGDIEEVDTNKTPQQKPKRRRHRPKVVKEGKPKTPKPVTPKPADSSKTPTGKRKYVRKNKVEKVSQTPPELAGSKMEIPAKKSCRKPLNFEEMEPITDDAGCTDNVCSETQVHHNINRSEISKSTIKVCHEIEVKMVGKTQAGTVRENCSAHHMEEGYLSKNGTETVRTSVPVLRNSALVKMKVHIQEDYKDVHMAANVQRENSAQFLLERETLPYPMSPDGSDCSSSVNLAKGNEQAKKSKRDQHCAVKQANTNISNMYGGHYNNLETYLIPWPHSKRKRTEKVQGHDNTAAKDCREIITLYPQNNNTIQNPYGSKAKNSMSAHCNPNKLLKNLHTDAECMIMAFSPKETPTKKRSRNVKRTRNLSSLIMAGHNMGKTCSTNTKVVYQNEKRIENFNRTNACMNALIAQTKTTLARKRRTTKRNLQRCYAKLSGSARDVLWTEMLDLIDKQLKCLDINKENPLLEFQERNAIVPFHTRYQEHNALVLYRRDGTVVPFRGSFDLPKKNRPRAKVDLDEETNKVWKLLLENINSEGVDGTDEDKAKWWEEERTVFRGRADSFIARMHLVQGDRRFSRWKGSVLDSVVGVFLTQNVSDHLSSSAFMALAAHFPLKSENHDTVCSVSNEPQVCLAEDTSNQPICGWPSLAPRDAEPDEIASVDKNVSEDSNTTQYEKEHDEKATSLISLQPTLDSLSRTQEKSGSCSESNSDAEILPSKTVHENLEDSISSLKARQKDDSSMLHEVYHENQEIVTNKLNSICDKSKSAEHSDKRQIIDKGSPTCYPVNNLYLQETTNTGSTLIECFEKSLATEPAEISWNKTENSASDQSTLTVESATQVTIHKKVTVSPQEATRPIESDNIIQINKNVLVESQSSTVGNLKVVEAWSSEKSSIIQQNLTIHPEETQEVLKQTAEVDLNECCHSLPKECSELDAATSKPKNKKSGKENTEYQDWDKLRKQAEANGRRKKTTDTMDSLDWEAVRCADVGEISHTIRERGMNNKLAERIKDFLNRLVKEHGSTDLEWLRDVPPDQAKEYLLSIRGLGLKSVECVRLLTLHHLAFPVDTNVGRIAVRLGWVPLQPLPESLQLHLLELYPVLESIQKYLWPRLCKLDQRTLYELHYQMITFGKVFCTKSKPNCNACPMRGECRHFASAFASARLALPGPEEKSVVIATEKRKEDINFTVNERTPLPLPHANKQSEYYHLMEVNDQSEAKAGINCCEPIIEEPATPEPESPTILEDIEDAFCEDPDEIPMIKLNIEQFTQNVQNYMQQNMELQDGEMSRALVSLGPEAASIPMPKLKNVSRLRTEHQVYELPDSHPLLEKLQLEKREPDDPSPYLLAIWTPGETANTIEPPERRCCSQGYGSLCNEKECFSCNSMREANSQTVRGTILIPCRTAMRGSFPLNGTYFQVNELFADNDSSVDPIDVPREWIWNLQRRTVYFGTSIPTIFKGLTTQGIQQCFWRGYVCVRGFDRTTRAPRPLLARLHFPASKVKRTRDEKNE
ncbi:hypothetical protein G4B88_000201 [Cannabis sativa]|uniref:HhH-GPD domain-containing protein n=1 Tax=Cannabis sativa TaxID=3483 RepID=A0A7J6GPF2_CANSA|nr:hypothetical protein G4B88_000201 [Cannabis sativa]